MVQPVTLIEVKRRERGLSQWDVARLTGIVQSRLSLIERGIVQPKREEAEKLKGILKIEVSSFSR